MTTEPTTAPAPETTVSNLQDGTFVTVVPAGTEVVDLDTVGDVSF